MGKVHKQIDGRLREFIEAQHVYFIGTAPAALDGHINVSPKGGRHTFRVIDERSVAYLDLTGSGAESIAHIRENGRIVVMFCAFDGPPNVVRLHGLARLITPTDAEWAEQAVHFPPHKGSRAIVLVDVDRVSSSCGFAVPNYDYVGDRDLLDNWTSRKSDAALATYRREKNLVSVDGLPALPQSEPNKIS